MGVIDLELFFRTKVENMLVTASWVEAVRQTLGLTAVSQVWSERPSWYFWISGAAGVYHLQMEGASGEGDLVIGSFSVKCYPFPHQGQCPGLSLSGSGHGQLCRAPRHHQEVLPATSS